MARLAEDLLFGSSPPPVLPVALRWLVLDAEPLAFLWLGPEL